MTGLNTIEKTYWMGAAIRPVAIGTAIARFFGTSSPKIIDAIVENIESDRQREDGGEPGAHSRRFEDRSDQSPRDGSMR